MQLYIDKTEDNEDFSNWLLQVLEDEMMANLDHRRLYKYEEYIKQTNIFDFGDSAIKNFNLVNIVYIFIKTLRKDTFKDTYLYTFNDHLKYDTATYYAICKFINYGNSEIKGYPFIVDILSNVQNNIEDYQEIFRVMNEL